MLGNAGKAGQSVMVIPDVNKYIAVRRLLQLDYPVIIIQIKHSVFDCRVQRQKRDFKDSLGRMTIKTAAAEFN